MHTGSCTNLIHKLANVIHEEWTGTGCEYTVEMSKADMNQLQTALMKPTNGDYNIAFMDEDGKCGGDGEESGKGHKGKKRKKKERKKKGKGGGGGVSEQKTNDDHEDDDDAQQHRGKKKRKNKGKSKGQK